jgi:uncharacterized protein YraI
MAKIKTHTRNILENSTVTSSPIGESSYPTYHLYDRRIGRNYQSSAVSTTTISMDQGAVTNYEVDTLVIPSGHNLTGLSITLSSSSNNVNWTVRSTWTQSGSGQIYKTFTAVTARYWRLVITSPSSKPYLGEIYLTKSYTWERNPKELDRGNYPMFNVQRMEDSGGRARYVEMGDKREVRNYELEFISGTHRTAISDLNTAWAAKNPFYLLDTDGTTLLFVELTSPIEFQRSGDYANCTFNVMEVLP